MILCKNIISHVITRHIIFFINHDVQNSRHPNEPIERDFIYELYCYYIFFSSNFPLTSSLNQYSMRATKFRFEYVVGTVHGNNQ